MSYPKEFFYEESTSHTRYQQEATSSLSIERLLRGNNTYWISSSLDTTKKKKRLVLADWSANSWPRDKIVSVIQKLKQLLEDGFNIDLWQDDKLLPLTLINLSRLNERSVRQAMATQKVQDILAKASVSYEKLFVLDDHWVRQLLSDKNYLEPRSLSAFEYHNASCKKLIFQAQPPITILLDDDAFLSEELHSFSNATVHSVPKRRWRLDNQSINFLLTNDVLHTQKLIFSKCDVKESHLTILDRLKSLNELSFSDSQLPPKTFKILSQTASLIERISFDNVTQLQFTDLEPNSFPLLTTIELNCIKLGARELSTILSAAPHLKKLTLVERSLESTSASVPHIDLTKLEELNLNYEAVSFIDILLFASPQLKKIELNMANNFVVGALSKDYLKQLETLSVKSSKDVSCNELTTLLLAAPNLKKLSLINLTNCIGSITLPKDYLSQLVVLDLTWSDCSLESAASLLEAAPNLKRIELPHYKNITKSISLTSECFSHLEALSIHATTLSPERIKRLFTETPKLQSISIDALTETDHLKQLVPDQLLQLENLRLSSTYLPPETLNALLLSAPHLKTLTLSYCRLTSLISLPKGCLPLLRSLNLMGSAISPENLISLLLAAPSLKTLSLNDCDNLKPNLLQMHQFPQEQLEVLKKALKEAEIDRILNKPCSTNSNSRSYAVKTTNIDADTKLDTNKTFRFARIFYAENPRHHPVVNYDRLGVFNRLFLNPSSGNPEGAFSISQEGDLDLNLQYLPTTHPLKDENQDQLFTAYYTRELNRNWEPLPSLSPNEVMRSFQSNSTTAIELAYSPLTNLYYVRLENLPTQLVSMEYTVEVLSNKKSIPIEIQDIINDFLSFGSSTLSITQGTGEEFLKALMQEKTGACRHRAVAFKAYMNRNHPDMEVRLITNHCHAFVELKIEDQWEMACLGGHPAKLEVTEDRPKPLMASLTNQVSSILAPSKSFNQLLQTWNRKTVAIGLLHYLQQCANNAGEKRLIEMPGMTFVNGFHFALEKYCKTIKRPFFYIHSPDDLVCSAPSMNLGERGFGILIPAPSGPLYDFLKGNEEGVLLINYTGFSSEDLVRFNALIDQVRFADGIPVPEAMNVIGLLATHSKLKPGSDFYSRFDVIEPCPIDESELSKLLVPVPNPGKATEFRIQLYNSQDWRAKLIGRWVPCAGQWLFEEGILAPLMKKIPEQGILTIHKGLWDDPEFVHFWQTALQTGEIHTPAGLIQVPEGLSLARNEDYDWQTLASNFCTLHKEPEEYIVLNPSTYHQLLSQYTIKENRLEVSDGFIKAAFQQGTRYLTLYLTHTLTEDLWAELLGEAWMHQIILKVYCASQVVFPDALKEEAIVEPLCPLLKKEEELPDFIIIETTDIEVTVTERVQRKPDSLVIDVTELSPSDLLNKTTVQLNDEEGELKFIFTETPCVLRLAQQPIILKGHFSSVLAETLASLLLKHPSNLTIISEDTSLFAFSNARVKHTVTAKDKIKILEQCYPEQVDVLKTINEPLVKLMARAHCIQRGQLNTDEAWAGYHSIELNNYDPQIFTAEEANNKGTQATETFIQQRKAAVQAVLKSQPYVFLTGCSGVGKTTFVQKELCNEQDRLYQEKELKQWATTENNLGNNYLFIDEANLKPGSFSEFEGLFNNPPSILIDGLYHELSSHHKVIFAGNPVNYGDERQLAPFFTRHGNAVLFQPIPSLMIFEKIIKPIFAGNDLPVASAQLAKPILDIYRFLCLTASDEIPISPRELEMMALLTLSFYKHNKEGDLYEITCSIAYQLAKPLVPAAHLDEYMRLFKPKIEPFFTNFTPLEQYNYYVSPSRQQAHSWLDSLITLRQDRIECTDDSQKYGGLGGLILQGEPGIGKSELVTSALLARQFIEAHDYQDPLKQANSFYRLPISMPLQQKESLLRKAFDEGAVVIIDEINSSPMMERLINALLMGQTPEGKRPELPGFLIIGTQNPTQMSGRREMSTALKRRTMMLNLEPYSSNEMEAILIRKGLAATTAKNLVSAYIQQQGYAIQHQLSPIPTFRDLLRAGKTLIKSSEGVHTLQETQKNRVDNSTDDMSKLHKIIDKFEKNHKRLEKKYRKSEKNKYIIDASNELIHDLKVAYEHNLKFANHTQLQAHLMKAICKAKVLFNSQRGSPFAQWFSNIIQSIKELFQSSKQKHQGQNRELFFGNNKRTTRAADVLFQVYVEVISDETSNKKEESAELVTSPQTIKP